MSILFNQVLQIVIGVGEYEVHGESVVKTLQELGYFIDDSGRVRVAKSGEYVTLSNIRGDANLLVNAITHYVYCQFGFLS